MAKRVKVSEITKEQEIFITKHLTLTPKKLCSNPMVPEPRPLKCWNVFGDYLHLPYLFSSKMNERINIKVEPSPKGAVDCSFRFIKELRDYQTPLMEDAQEHLNMYGTGTIWTHPGSGKTAMGMYLAAKVTTDKPVLIVLPSKVALIKSWEGTVRFFTDATVYIVGTRVDPVKLLASKVVICLDSRLKKLPLGFLDCIGVAIIDECHTFAKTQGRITTMLSVICDYLILMTATFMIENGMHRFLHLSAGHHHVRKEYTLPLRVLKVNTNVRPVLPEPDIGLLRYKLIRHEQYTGWIVKAIQKYIKTEKILVLTWLTEQIDILMLALKAADIPATSYFGSQKQYHEGEVCVSTLAKIGFGFDEAYCAIDFSGVPFSAILLPLSVKDPAFYEQVIGRGMRSSNPLFITFIDSHFMCKSHWKKNLEWINSHNVDLQEIDATKL